MPGTISAQAVVATPPEQVFEFLSDLGNHWLLADRFIDVVSLDRTDGGAVRGGSVRMRGPLGLRRTATTRVIETDPFRRMAGTAELSGGTTAHVSWQLEPVGGRTRVTLGARLVRASAPDRLLLALGGRTWIARRFEKILETLAQHLLAGTVAARVEA